MAAHPSKVYVWETLWNDGRSKLRFIPKTLRVIYDKVATVGFSHRWNTAETELWKAGRRDGKLSYFSFSSLTLAPTELSWSSSLFFLLSVFLRFLNTQTQRQGWSLSVEFSVCIQPIFIKSAFFLPQTATRNSLWLQEVCGCVGEINIILRCFLEWYLCVCVCSLLQ